MRRAGISPRLKDYFLKSIDFHTYPAPGLIIGVFMVEYALELLEAEAGEKLYAVSETTKCAPDPLQVIAHCTTGNHRLRVIPIGRFAITLNRASEKTQTLGVRVFLDPKKLPAFPRINRWFTNDPSFDQRKEGPALLGEIFTAGRKILSSEQVMVKVRPKQKWHQAACTRCGEMVPNDLLSDGICAGCSQGSYYAKT
jgi:formylmethanofuran dehydrogenase subunit E